ncbi:hypothetical protein Poly30_20800 [Planctomycetes bacterium Poly30]|uniref:Uncharacterized protein n=1 Tax=Saltatorellus ferox TaxID=2528018 RepID=A0A518ER58_9BACT|nr:hypothetical protein Poly30_20800 [Planctomycetes bacterium Poly30]
MNFTLPAAAAALLALAPSAAADLTTYTQDFEGLDIASPTALDADGWKIFANVFNATGGYLYGYGTFAAPNGGPGFSAIASGLGGAAQGAQYVNAYSDYNNVDHGNGNYIEANLFQEQTIGAADVGNTWTFDFDYLKAPFTNGDGDSTTIAFIKVLKLSDGSFSTLAFPTVDTTGASDINWASGSISLTIDPTWAGELLQVGFSSTATAYNDTGRYYDNISFDAPGSMPPSLSPYAQDFENLGLADPAALAGDSWNIFANVFDPMGGYLYGYGVFDAPNGGAGFSAIATGDGGPTQMLQYLNAYSDYGNADHANGNVINANVFQEQTIGAVDVGNTWRFAFDYRKNATVTNGDGATTTQAFIKVIKVSDGSFATLFLNEFDSTSASTAAWASMALDILIDPTFAGEVLQFGYSSFATNYADSGRYYDNIQWGPVSNPGLGSIVCLGNPTSTGFDAPLTAVGSDVAADNDLTLNVDGLPMNAIGYFVHSSGGQLVYNPGMSEGHICIASFDMGRFSMTPQNSGAAGSVSMAIDLTSLPTTSGPLAILAGDTRSFQYWTRDTAMGGGATSNFSSAISITFQ